LKAGTLERVAIRCRRYFFWKKRFRRTSNWPGRNSGQLRQQSESSEWRRKADGDARIEAALVVNRLDSVELRQLPRDLQPDPNAAIIERRLDPLLERDRTPSCTVIPGVVFSGAMNGHLRAYSTKDGAVLWDFNTAGQPYRTLGGGTSEGGVLDAAGPTVADGMLYVHSGYAGRSGNTGTVLLAFSPDGQ